jgi:hypothetical protein
MRNVVQRRLASTENTFIKEREAVKHHAAGSTRTSELSSGGEYMGLSIVLTSCVQSSGARSLSSTTITSRCELSTRHAKTPYKLGSLT